MCLFYSFIWYSSVQKFELRYISTIWLCCVPNASSISFLFDIFKDHWLSYLIHTQHIAIQCKNTIWHCNYIVVLAQFDLKIANLVYELYNLNVFEVVGHQMFHSYNYIKFVTERTERLVKNFGFKKCFAARTRLLFWFFFHSVHMYWSKLYKINSKTFQVYVELSNKHFWSQCIILHNSLNQWRIPVKMKVAVIINLIWI